VGILATLVWESAAGYLLVVVWVALALIVALVMAGAWACYVTRRLLAATSDAQQRRLLVRAAGLSLGVGGAILVIGLVAFVVTGYNWLVLAAIWPYGLLHTGLVAGVLFRAQKRSGLSKPLR
jgi:hypothetical protein